MAAAYDSASLGRRTVAALLAAPLLLAAILAGPQALLAVLVVVALVSAWEAAAVLANILGERFSPWNALPSAGLILFLAYLDPGHFPLYLPLLALVGGALLVTGRRLDQQALRGGGLAMLAALYSAGLITFLYLIRRDSGGPGWLLAVVLATWANDSLAYLVGLPWGRHRLAPGISPRKSWEGAAAGWAGAAVVGLAAGWLLAAPLWGGLGLGLLVGVGGTAGDLFESWLKRRAGLKDSGRFLPGHGGALDRFDSLLFAGPLAYGFLRGLGL